MTLKLVSSVVLLLSAAELGALVHSVHGQEKIIDRASTRATREERREIASMRSSVRRYLAEQNRQNPAAVYQTKAIADKLSSLDFSQAANLGWLRGWAQVAGWSPTGSMSRESNRGAAQRSGRMTLSVDASGKLIAIPGFKTAPVLSPPQSTTGRWGVGRSSTNPHSQTAPPSDRFNAIHVTPSLGIEDPVVRGPSSATGKWIYLEPRR